MRTQPAEASNLSNPAFKHESLEEAYSTHPLGR
ncbi:hypothetical protein BCCR75502_00839 [Burkholderia sola]|nr:hypothetical protein BCCR75389_00828 [Burkholderia cenocepacia]CAG2263420.1 hypothetical protein BCCR75386_00840 [Burkholderia cenocepacia]CAG2263532.1 hypothetical protein BCCR75388_00841 [Burkholderia cenocepacia]CAG2263612.1 hypothetical protein BCCR75384_00841 [Burkholderia cenocepacia]CAG2263614.1 hypothetical protein BCCR75387_00841 [Burkholderia cenocepacia]